MRHEQTYEKYVRSRDCVIHRMLFNTPLQLLPRSIWSVGIMWDFWSKVTGVWSSCSTGLLFVKVHEKRQPGTQQLNMDEGDDIEIFQRFWSWKRTGFAKTRRQFANIIKYPGVQNGSPSWGSGCATLSFCGSFRPGWSWVYESEFRAVFFFLGFS